MNRDDRLAELKKLGNIHGYTLSSNRVFSEWQGRTSALLSYDPIAKHKFDNYCDFILDDHEFGRGMISHETIEAQKKIHALIERVTADLEINRPEVSIYIPENFSVPDSMVIPDAAEFGCPDIEITRNTDDIPISTKRIVAEYKHPLPTEVDIPKTLEKEHGLLWLMVHGHWLVRFKVFAFLFFIFGCGAQAAQNQDFMKVWTWIVTPITFASKLLTK